jgi:hypothetical protein
MFSARGRLRVPGAETLPAVTTEDELYRA